MGCASGHLAIFEHMEGATSCEVCESMALGVSSAGLGEAMGHRGEEEVG